MVPTRDLRSPLLSNVADLRDVPLAEMPALALSQLDRTIGRVLPAPATKSVPVAAFQSAL
jgi:FXSXX-COOH protein